MRVSCLNAFPFRREERRRIVEPPPGRRRHPARVSPSSSLLPALAGWLWVAWMAAAAGLCLDQARAAGAPPGAAAAAPAPSAEEQQALLKEILGLLPKSEPWEKWLQATGTMPPDFKALPAVPYLPDPLR